MSENFVGKMMIFPNHRFEQIKLNWWDDSMRPAHVGVITLEMSKRIMNRVMNVCQDVGATLTLIPYT